MCVQRRLFDVSLIVTWDGSNGLIRARPGRTIGAIETIERLAIFSEVTDSERFGEPVWKQNIKIIL